MISLVSVIPANAGIQSAVEPFESSLDSRFRGNDGAVR